MRRFVGVAWAAGSLLERRRIAPRACRARRTAALRASGARDSSCGSPSSGIAASIASSSSALFGRSLMRFFRHFMTTWSSASGMSRSGRRCRIGIGDLPLVQIEQLAAALRDDRQLARERLVHEHAERVEVGLRDDVRADALLRRHVLGRAQRVAGLRERLGARELAHAEVEDLRAVPSSQRKTLPGLRSRCTTPLLCAAAERAAHADEDRDREARARRCARARACRRASGRGGAP